MSFVGCQKLPVDFLSWAHFSTLPRFDREFVPSFQGHGLVGGKNGTQFEMNFVFNEGLCVNK